jgi:hypothetical protein
MSLNWNLGKIKNHGELCWLPAKEGQADGDREMNPKTNDLIWATMAVNLGEITEENAAEFHRRLDLWSAALGIPKYEISLEDVRAHVGLKTNVGDKTLRAWMARVAGIVKDELARDKRRESERRAS